TLLGDGRIVRATADSRARSRHPPTVTADGARLVVDLPAWVGEAAAPGRAFRDDQAKMALVIRLAEENVARGDGGPFRPARFHVGPAQAPPPPSHPPLPAPQFPPPPPH